MNLIQWLSFSIIILLSMFAVYCVESKPSFPNDLTFYQKRRLLIESNGKDKNTTPASRNNLIPTNLVLVSTLDGSIRGIDRFEGRVHWTLKGGPGSSLIKSNSHFQTHKLYKEGPATASATSFSNEGGLGNEKEEEEKDDDDYKLFVDTLRDIESDEESDSEEDDSEEEDPNDFNLEQYSWESKQEEHEEPETYYIIEPQDGGTL
jgi:hypothetical protein